MKFQPRGSPLFSHTTQPSLRDSDEMAFFPGAETPGYSRDVPSGQSWIWLKVERVTGPFCRATSPTVGSSVARRLVLQFVVWTRRQLAAEDGQLAVPPRRG